MATEITAAIRLAIILPAVLLSACSTIFQTVGELPDPSRLQVPLADLRVPMKPLGWAEIKDFTECMAPLSAQLQVRFEQLSRGLTPRDGGEADGGHFRFSAWNPTTLGDARIKNLKENMEALVKRFSAPRGIPGGGDPDGSKLAKAIEDLKARLYHRVESDAGAAKSDLGELYKRTQAYFKAYFRANRVDPKKLLSRSPEKTSQLRGKLAGKLKLNPDDPRLLELMETLASELQTAAAKFPGGDSDDGGFIAREGTRYGFPGISGDNAGASIDHNQIGADAIRINFEAIRDTFAPVPVLSDSTPAALAPAMGIDVFGSDPASDGETKAGVWHIDGMNGTLRYPYKLSLSEFQDIEANARSTESAVAEAVGKAIRGGSWGSLNNEALAKFIETAAGVVARHATERAQWCAAYSKKGAGG